MDVNNADIEATPVCDLILKDKCQYGYMMDQGFDIQYIRPLAKVVIASSSGLPVQRLS